MKSEQRQAIEELVYRSCLALDARDFKAFLDLCDAEFRYSITTHSPEIRRDMVWLDHDRKGMETLFTNLPKHNSDHPPITRHATVYTVDAMIEDAVRSAIDRRDGAQVLALEPAIAQDIVAAVRGKLGEKPGVILVSGDVRRHLRGLLEPELPDVAILAAHELAPGTAVTTVGRIDV